MHRSLLATVAVLAAGVFGGDARADDIPLGFDYFKTLNGTWFDFGSGVGVVDLEGVPIIGRADTIIERKQTADFPFFGNNLWPGPETPGTDVTIDVEMVGLSLKSVNPVFVSGPDSFFDVFITLDPATPSVGSMTISHEWADGVDFDPEGTFDSTLLIFADALFVPAGGGPGQFLVDLDGIPLASTDTLWTHAPGIPLWVDEVEEAHPGIGVHRAQSVPEPGTLALLMLVALLRRR